MDEKSDTGDNEVKRPLYSANFRKSKQAPVNTMQLSIKLDITVSVSLIAKPRRTYGEPVREVLII